MSVAPHENDGTNVDADTSADVLDPIREHRSGVETVANRADRLGAAAHVLLTLADGEQPSAVALDAAGWGVSSPSDSR